MGFELRKAAMDVGIVTTNIDRMLTFYGDVLALPAEETFEFPGFGTVHRFAVGDSILRLFHPDGQATPAPAAPADSIYAAVGIRYFGMVWANLEEVVEACRAFGVNVPRPITETRPGVFMATVQDPDGNWIEMQSWS